MRSERTVRCRMLAPGNPPARSASDRSGPAGERTSDEIYRLRHTPSRRAPVARVAGLLRSAQVRPGRMTRRRRRWSRPCAGFPGPLIHWRRRGHPTEMVRAWPREARQFPFQIGGEVRGKSGPAASTTGQGERLGGGTVRRLRVSPVAAWHSNGVGGTTTVARSPKHGCLGSTVVPVWQEWPPVKRLDKRRPVPPELSRRVR